MQLSHTLPVASATFDEPNLVSAAGLVPLMKLADQAGLRQLGDEHLSVPSDKGANAGLKLSSLVAGMAAGADSIDDMALLRHGAMGKVFDRPCAPSTLGSFLRKFTFGHVRQADAIASRFLLGLAEHTGLLGDGQDAGTVLVDIDDTIIEVHGYQKQGAAFGYSGVRGLNALLATVSTDQIAPVIAAQRLRKGSAGSPRGAVRLAADTLALVRRTRLAGRDVLVRADSAFYSHALVAACLKAGADVSITVRMDMAVKRAIANIDDQAWTTIRYTDAIHDEDTGRWISRAEVAEIPFTAFTSRKKAEQIPGRLVVRRIPDLNPNKDQGQATLFDTWRFHAFFTTTTGEKRDTVVADKAHRAHAIIENVHADLKASALTHLPSVISSPRHGQGCDLQVCVMDGVVDVAIGWPGSARADEFRVVSPGRVAAWGRAGDAGGAGRAEHLGECLAQLAVVLFEVADPLGGRFESAVQGFVGGALSLRGRRRSGRRLVSAAERLDLGAQVRL